MLAATNVLQVEVERADATFRSQPHRLCPRMIDEPQPAGHRPWIGAGAQLASGWEHGEALWALITGDFGLTPRAPWSLLRSVFEAGFWTQWLLEPEDSLVRRRRGLRLEVLNHKQKHAWLGSYSLDPEQEALVAADEKRVGDIYRAEASALGLTWAQASHTVVVVDELKKLRSVRSAGPLGGVFVATWRSLSGFQHGYPYALIAHGDLGIEVPIPGGKNVSISINDDAFVGSLMASYGMMSDAAQLYVRRSTAPL